MIRERNKAKRLELALQYQAEAEAGFLDVVYSNETSVQLETHTGAFGAASAVSCPGTNRGTVL